MKIKSEIAAYTQKIEQFINTGHLLLENTKDATERAHRHEIFDTLLLLATYADSQKLEEEFNQSLPLNPPNTFLNELCHKLREINWLCTCTLPNEHEVYKSFFANFFFLTPQKKEEVKAMISQEIIQLIFTKTETNVSNVKAGNKFGMTL
ncbi:hypothetical protein [Legionella hackeliae]|uniref:Uncharacterized protein n=1 Tax=Legionella hackeliae TaxID=449 RepID=A0A0A8US43_LEGHA|nr:hypothetical protein [Legionella hackeliae]KTD13141.1 hypothetical protein Lhac_1010 [Legionella hackeliae]CEK11548.1 conserved protein of unknown function [Legionella hackeliae]STX48319.1 Uncharacterised protein [Legionella hackeliae]